MNKAQLEGQWGFMNMVLGNARRQIELLPEDKLSFRPVPEIRSAGELATHMHIYLTELTETVLQGKHINRDEPKFATKGELLKWMGEQVKKGNENFSKITDAQLSPDIEAWGEKFPAWQLVSWIPTELLHHRGQFMTYLRLMGVEPVFAYDFGS
jgi:uncharacterized damage-inducible protein DinB